MEIFNVEEMMQLSGSMHVSVLYHVAMVNNENSTWLILGMIQAVSATQA